MSAAITERITKLERLAASTNHPGEREACLKRIQALRERHGIPNRKVWADPGKIREYEIFYGFSADSFAAASAAAAAAGTSMNDFIDAAKFTAAFIDSLAIYTAFALDGGFKKWLESWGERKGLKIDFPEIMRTWKPSALKSLYKEYLEDKEL